MLLSDMSSPPLRIELRPSLALRLALLLLAALAVVSLLLSAAPIVSLVIVPLLLAFSWPRAAAHRWKEIVLRSDGTATALDATGVEHDIVPIRLQRRGLLSVITVEGQGRVQSLLFTPETLTNEHRRRLVLWFDRHLSTISEAGAPMHV